MLQCAERHTVQVPGGARQSVPPAVPTRKQQHPVRDGVDVLWPTVRGIPWFVLPERSGELFRVWGGEQVLRQRVLGSRDRVPRANGPGRGAVMPRLASECYRKMGRHIVQE